MSFQTALRGAFESIGFYTTYEVLVQWPETNCYLGALIENILSSLWIKR
jgi:hypothetical protein